MTIRIVIADDHSVVRAGLLMALSRDPELEVVGEAVDGAEAIELVRQLHPDVVVMDVNMPNIDGITATTVIRATAPDTEVVALTGSLDDDSVVAAVRAGAIGYLLKDTASGDISRAIHRAAEKQVELSPTAAARLMRELQAPKEAEPLTARETDVLRLIGQGYVNRDIAGALNINEKTVSAHVSNILAKLGMQSRTQAAVHAVRIGLVQPDDPGASC